MKRFFVLMMMVGLAASSQAQIGNLVGRAIKKKVEQTIEKKMEDALGVNNETTQPAQMPDQKDPGEAKEGRVPTAEEVMSMVPQLPSPQQLADYACESKRENPRTLKLVANPTTTFLAKMVAASAAGYAVTMGGSNPNFDEQLLKEFGLTEEQYDAMSEGERKELNAKLADELQERYLRTADRLASDSEYKVLMEEYSAVEQKINQLYEKADAECRELWTAKYASKGMVKESDLCAYYNEAMPIQYKAVLEAMRMRKTQQLPIAKKMDAHVQLLAEKNPKDVFSGFYNQGGLCATSYISDAARLTVMDDPR